MISRTKFSIDEKTIVRLFKKAKIGDVGNIKPLGAGEFNAVYSAEKGNKTYVIKLAPDDNAPTLIYEKNMMRSEVFWYEQMRKGTSIKVPEIYFSDFTRETIPTDYFIMEMLPGVTLDKAELTKEEKQNAEEMKACMTAQIHSVKNDKFGYIQNELYDNWYLAVKAMFENLLNDCRKKGKKSLRGEKMLGFIEKYKDILEKAECCMVNFDIWDPNIMCERKDGKIEYAWIDPERSFWGDRILDFSCLESMKPLKEKTISLAAYNRFADNPVNVSEDEIIRYAVAQGLMGLIMETEKYYRYTPHHFGWWRNVGGSMMFYKNAFSVL